MDGTLKVGNVEIVALSDGEIEFSTPLSAVFEGVTSEQWRPFRERYPGTFASPDAWQLNIGCYLLRSQGRVILVDTGLGPVDNPRFKGVTGTLFSELKALGVAPEDVDTVFLTHTHGDHIGWNVQNGARAFPKARYTLSRREWQWVPERIAAAAPGMQAAETQVLPLGDAVDLVEDGTALTDEITAIATPGHTPGHMSLIVSSNGEKACITGDAILHPAQITEPDWAPRMDFEPLVANETRRSLLEGIEAEGLTVVACHFPRPGFGQVVRLEGRRYWQAQ